MPAQMNSNPARIVQPASSLVAALVLAVAMIAGTLAIASPAAGEAGPAPTPRTLPSCTEDPYADVSVEHTFCAEIAWAKAEGIVMPRVNDMFRPGEVRMRGQVAANLGLVTDLPPTEACSSQPPPFSDLFPHTVFCRDIARASAAGLVDGYSDGTFRPFAPVSRQAAAAFIYRLDDTRPDGGPCVAPLSSPFPDVSDQHPFCTEIATLAADGVMAGYGDGTFRATAPLSHQAWIVFLVRHLSAA